MNYLLASIINQTGSAHMTLLNRLESKVLVGVSTAYMHLAGNS